MKSAAVQRKKFKIEKQNLAVIARQVRGQAQLDSKQLHDFASTTIGQMQKRAVPAPKHNHRFLPGHPVVAHCPACEASLK